jgi:hypothetical protein
MVTFRFNEKNKYIALISTLFTVFVKKMNGNSVPRSAVELLPNDLAATRNERALLRSGWKRAGEWEICIAALWRDTNAGADYFLPISGRGVVPLDLHLGIPWG